MERELNVLFRRIPAERGRCIRQSDIIAILPGLAANYGQIAIVGSTFYEPPFGYTGSEISLLRYRETKPVRLDQVPEALLAYLRWNPEDEGKPYQLKIRKRLDYDVVRESWKALREREG
jgi:hypothetical protein